MSLPKQEKKEKGPKRKSSLWNAQLPFQNTPEAKKYRMWLKLGKEKPTDEEFTKLKESGYFAPISIQDMHKEAKIRNIDISAQYRVCFNDDNAKSYSLEKKDELDESKILTDPSTHLKIKQICVHRGYGHDYEEPYATLKKSHIQSLVPFLNRPVLQSIHFHLSACYKDAVEEILEKVLDPRLFPQLQRIKIETDRIMTDLSIWKNTNKHLRGIYSELYTQFAKLMFEYKNTQLVEFYFPLHYGMGYHYQKIFTPFYNVLIHPSARFQVLHLRRLGGTRAKEDIKRSVKPKIVRDLVTLLRQTKTLTDLDLSESNLSDIQMDEILTAIAENVSSFQNNSYRTTEWKRFNFSKNRCTWFGLQSLPFIVERSEALETLHISHVQFSATWNNDEFSDYDSEKEEEDEKYDSKKIKIYSRPPPREYTFTPHSFPTLMRFLHVVSKSSSITDLNLSFNGPFDWSSQIPQAIIEIICETTRLRKLNIKGIFRALPDHTTEQDRIIARSNHEALRNVIETYRKKISITPPL